MKRLLFLLAFVPCLLSAQIDTLMSSDINVTNGTRVLRLRLNTVINQVNLLESGSPVMIYPSAGIPLSTGSAWGTSITNNSTNWNTAYGWGNHASAGYATLASPNFTGTVAGITASMVGLGNVNNTSDANKPISTAQQTALNLKANIASPTFTGTVSGISAAMVGLGNVNNTSDVNKPISTAQQTALNLKANTNLVNLLSDTIAIFAFGAGGGATSDSACFQTTSFYGSFFNAGSDSLIITNTRAVMVDGAGIDTCSVAIQFHTTFNSASATILNGAATATGGSTKFTTGLSTAITSNNRIPPNTWVWMETPYVSVGNKPYMLSVTMSGYKKSMY